MSVRDKDVVGIAISTTELKIDEPGTASYTIVLTKVPTKPVIITATITGVDEDSMDDAISISSEDNKKLKLTFTVDNWNIPQTVTVTASNDDDAEDATETITHAITGTDPAYKPATGGPTAEDVTINVKDDDTREVIISDTELSINELDKDTYTVKLRTKPTANVAITIATTSAAITVLPAIVTFTSKNWNTVQTVTITTVSDDDAADEEATITHAVTNTGGYGNVTADDVVVSVNDSETAGITLSKTELGVLEGVQVTYTIVLDVKPKDGVTITPTSSDNADVSVSPATITFTTTNWDEAQTVTLMASNVDADKEITISHKIKGSKEYKALTGTETVALTVKAKEVAGVIVSTTRFNIAEGETGTYTIGLTKKPKGNVVIRLSGNNEAATISPASLSFTPVDWDTPKTVTVSGTEDEDAVDGTAMITHSITGSAEYASLSVGGVEVTVIDDETAAIVFTPTSQDISVMEGETVTYTIKLESKPAGTANVTVALMVAEPNTIGLSPGLLTFTTTNWNTAQTVVVTGVEDPDHKDEEATINHVVGGSINSGYKDINSPKTRVSVSVTDDDSAGLTFSKTKIGITNQLIIPMTPRQLPIL